jgi:hypothetical protein
MEEYIILIYNGPQISYVRKGGIHPIVFSIIERLGQGTIDALGGAEIIDIGTVDCLDISRNLTNKDLCQIIRLLFMGEAEFSNPKKAKAFVGKLGFVAEEAFDDHRVLSVIDTISPGESICPVGSKIAGIFSFVS